MANLINTSKWNMTNTTNDGESFTLTNGQMRQSIKLPGETKYKLSFNCTELINLKSYFLFKLVALDGKHTYLVPVTFLGENSIKVELVEDIRTVELFIIGSLTVTDIGLYEDGALTESQKDAIGKVENESDKWDRINDVTNEQGNLIASRLEGSINNALNSIFGGNGTMEIIDGTIIFRDKDTDVNSTMAMRLNFAGLAIANSKKVDGSWDWKTFGTGQGFVADYMTTGTLSAITIDGVTITATDIIGGKITGAVFDGGTLENGKIKSSELEGSTIYAGTRATGNYILIAPDKAFEVYRNNKIMLELYSNTYGGYLSINDVAGDEALRISTGVFYGARFDALKGKGEIKNTCNAFTIRTGGVLSTGLPLTDAGNIRIDTTKDNSTGTQDGNIFITAGSANGTVEISGKNIAVLGDFRVVGAKDAIVPTQHYGVRELYCDESDRSYFTTKGIATTNNCKCRINLDPVFIETIELNSEYPYIINLTPYSDAKVWIDSVDDYGFIVASNKDTKFSYVLNAIRISFGSMYLNEFKGLTHKELAQIQRSVVERRNTYNA